MVSFIGRLDDVTALFTNFSPVLKATNTFAPLADGNPGSLQDPGVRAAVENLLLFYNGFATFDTPVEHFLGKGSFTGSGGQNFSGVGSEMELIIAGDPAFTNDVVVKFTITATDKDTGEPIPAADITVASEAVSTVVEDGVTNSVAWQSYKEHTTNGVSVVITGHANWTATLGAGIYRLTLEGEGFLFLDVDTNSPSGTNQCATNTNAVPLIYYNYGSGPSVLTPPPTNELKTIIGSLLTFTGKLPTAAAGAIFTNFQWTIGRSGDTVSNFFIGTNVVTNASGIIETQHVGQAVAEYSKTNQSVTFAWWKPGKAVVKFNCDINGKGASAQCEVNVTKPPASLIKHADGENIPDLGGPVSIGNVFTEDDGSYSLLKLGRAMPNNLGILFSITNREDYGLFGWIQIINSSTRTRYRDQAEIVIDGQNFSRTNVVESASGLDKAARLPDDKVYYDDSPGSTFKSNLLGVEGGNLGASIDDKFTLFLMFNPSGAGVWVPIASVDWGWKAALTNSGANPWVLNTNWPNSSTVGTNNTAPGYPGWIKRVLGGGQ